MASANVKARCMTCGKANASCKCGGCSQDFCYKHLRDHRQGLSKQLDEVEGMRKLFWQTLHEQKSNPQKHSLIEQIDKWKQDSIEKIHQTAEEARQLVHQHITEHFTQIESKLDELTNQLQQSRAEEDFFESDLLQWNEKLTELKERLAKPSNIRVHQDQTPLVTKISVNILFNQVNTVTNARWTQDGNSVAGDNTEGIALRKFDTPEPESSVPQLTETRSPRPDPQLVRLFKSVYDQGTVVHDSEIIKYIREHMDSSEKFYIRNIVLSYLEACLINRDPQKKIQEDIAKRRMTVLNAIIEHKFEAEIQAVYAIQNFVSKLEHPPKMARLLFDIFFDEECVSEEAFFEWLNYPDPLETEGHAIVEMSTRDFFTWLQLTETEVEGEEN